MTDLPISFLDAMKKLLASDYDAFISTYEQSSFRGIRFNNKKVSEDARSVILKGLKEEYRRVPWTQNGYYVSDSLAISKSPYYYAGLYYIQEPSAMSPAAYLPVDKSDIVLDLCAAPGGKATELASRAGFLLANDISATRAQALLKNLELSGNPNIAVTAETPEKLSGVYAGYFDKILVDAPCSGEGMFRKDNTLINSWLERGPEYYQQLQLEILDKAYLMLKPGGQLLYSTCTFAVSEDEYVINEFLSKHPDLELKDIPDRYPDFCEGQEGCQKAARLFPHKIEGEGHFLALIGKAGADTLSLHCLEEKVIQIDNRLYKVPKDFMIAKGIRYLRTGLLLGEYKKDKFIPAQALAMSLDILDTDIICRHKDIKIDNKTEFGFSILNLEYEDERVKKYLKGETIFTENDALENGYVLVSVNGYPLGWGRINRGQVKNDYPKGWVMN